jgi:hypothetical protein
MLENNFSLIIAISTAVYTAISLFLLIESIKTRKQKVSPCMIAYLKSTEDRKILMLVIKNVGEGTAKDVKINILKDYDAFGKPGKSLSNGGVFKNGFNAFPSQHELQFFLNVWEGLKDDKKGYVEIDFSYKRIDNKKYKEIITLPFNQATGQSYADPPETYIGKIAFHLGEISKALKK